VHDWFVMRVQLVCHLRAVLNCALLSWLARENAPELLSDLSQLLVLLCHLRKLRNYVPLGQ